MKSSFFEIRPDILVVYNNPILFLKDINSIVIADLHLGVEAIMQEEGSFVPHNLTSQIIGDLSNYLKELKPDRLILNGDVKHSFYQPTKIENRDVKKFLKEISKLVPEVHIIKGNHDVFISWVAQEFSNVIVHSHKRFGRYYFVHGDKELEEKLDVDTELIIIGHLHPVLESRVKGLQKIRKPAFMFGPLKNQTQFVIVMPAFTQYSTGSPIHPNSKTHHIVPLLRENADLREFELYVLDEKETFHFPKLKLWM